MKLSAIVLAILLAVACGSSSSPTAPTRTAMPYDGNWSGQTAQAQAISFNVASNAIHSLAFQFTASAPCNVVGGVVSGNTVVGAIANDGFTINGGDGPASWTLTGSFSSGTMGGGTLTVTLTNPTSICSTVVQTTWTAQKMP